MYQFIKDNGVRLGLIKDGLHPLTTKPDVDKSMLDEINKHNTQYFLESNILKLAELYLDSIIYFPVYLDWRGRLYCQVDYLSFQGCELAKSLLEFANGEIIGDIKSNYYFKIYGANCYGLDKLSFDNRINWINDNLDKIASFDHELIYKAKSPFLFIAFLLEYQNDSNFTNFPIQIDATCNGLQHLASIIGDLRLASLVNLMESDTHKNPNDIYSNCIDYIKYEISKLIESDPYFINLSQIQFDRKMIKKCIMTIPYNVSIMGIKLQLEEFFHKVYIKSDNKYIYTTINPKTNNIIFTGK